ncbi:MAG: thiol:disulfide interchange protein DsbA/DsbL [Candidatus Thiothrix singaporensis]|uniref:Thiol:disulfide interchange protein n=1 Tax=Candidatus Thiothrix singaporensis TaxID=2799669 RepID=A0A7L6AV72_9GAMM|nr:MAG: thiol:disulfide interchange protein DsbA/DsbL [Candidatus Thiothrix singaporensis]
MKNVFGHTLGLVMTIVLVLTGCVPESGQADEFKEGTDYALISPPIPVQAAGKVEVTELFWYGCPHCYHLEPTINKFLQHKPDNVVFQRVPATLSPRWTYHARLYYVGQLLDPDGSKRVHGKIFDAIQQQRRKIDNDEALTRFFTDLGFSADQVNNALQSMELNAMMARADEVGQMSKADSVPLVIINGKYKTSPSMVGNEDKLLKVMDYLIKRETK